MKLLIRADASPQMGTGHVMRMLALALAARKAGLDVALTGHVAVAWVVDRLAHEQLAFYPLDGVPPAAESPQPLLAAIECHAPDWVVLDGYHFGLDCQQAVQAAGLRLLMVDDYQHQPEYAADLLLNQNIGCESWSYGPKVARTLLGPRYALLRPEFTVSAASERQAGRNLLLTLGGGDFSTRLRELQPVLSDPALRDWTLRVIAGAMPPAVIAEILAACPAELVILPRVDDVPGLMRMTDLAITAGGSTCWELCALGVPFLTVDVAENQRGVIAGLAQAGVAQLLTAESLRVCLADDTVRNVLRQNGRRLVDGHGAERVVIAMGADPR